MNEKKGVHLICLKEEEMSPPHPLKILLVILVSTAN